MFLIDQETKQISCNKRNAFSFFFTLENEALFKANDFIEFKVYRKKEMDKEPLIYKTLTITEPTDTIEITLTTDDTDMKDVENKPIEYWYEIELNNDNTLIGYDENGPKIFQVYPKGVDING